MITAGELQERCGGQLQGPASASFASFAFDSRRMLPSQPTCFIALTSAHADGHLYAANAANKGAQVLVVERLLDLPHFKGAQLIHPHPLEVLKKWAAYKRDIFKGPVVAITGSNGKTIVKEWAYQLMGAPHNLFRTPGSFNSALGVPLSLSMLQGQMAAIIEVGVDRSGEMADQKALVQPTYGVFTHFGDAHDSGFDDADQKFVEKWLLIQDCQKIVCERKWYEKAKSLDLPLPSALLWGKDEALDPEHFQLTFTGPRLSNAMNAAGIALLLGASRSSIKERIRDLEPLEMRMQLRAARGGGSLLEDTYSSDLDSLRIALEELMLYPAERHLAVLSVLSTDEATQRAREMVDAAQLDKVWWISNPEELPLLTQELNPMKLDQSILLIKGQRMFKLEQLAATLREQMHSTWTEINLGAMRRNLNAFRKQVRPETGIMAMVKAGSYGTGNLEVAQWLQELHVDYLGVAFAQEALTLRAQGISVPMLVMNAESDQFPYLAAANCEVELHSIHQLKHWKSQNDPSRILRLHLKIETGMHRLGFLPSELPQLLQSLKEMSHVDVVGVFSHLSSADLPEERDFTLGQITAFEQALATVRQSFPHVKGHLLNTHGIVNFPEAQHQLVRLGLGLYGVGTYPHIEPLDEVLTWKCRISKVGQLQPGDSLGYSRSYKATTAVQYATLPVGYADGLLRSLSKGKGRLFVNGHACPILGNVCMDMTMIDVTGLKVQPGDEVIILGREQSAEDLAAAAGTIAYEILTRIGPRVPRLYVKD